MVEKKLPPRMYLGELCRFDVGHILLQNDLFGEGDNRLFRFILPPFQRPPVWNQRQQVKFMESLILGLPVGTYTYSQSYGLPTDGWLIDGQQRMNAIKEYLDNQFKVFGYYYRDLGIVDIRRFEGMSFPAYVLKDCEEKEMLERYIALNYGGTPHTESDKAKSKRRLRKLEAKGGG